MSAAIAQPCVVCHSSSSKYKCTRCRSATCSLACSKQHAAQPHQHQSPSTSNQASGSNSKSPSELPSLQLRNEIIEPPSVQRFSKAGQFVGMKDYDSKQLMEDFEYLQYLGKCVTKVGKDIVKNGWLKDVEQQQESGRNQHADNKSGLNRGGPPNKVFHQHIPAEVKNRRTFESWIRKLRLPVMLVPEGMSLRKQNHSRYKNNTKQLLCTVEIRSVSSSAFSSKQRSLLHHISWEKQVSEVVVKEMDKKAKQKGNTADIINGASIDNWRDTLCIAFSVSNERLRNESSSKFLEWWQRQVKNGTVKPDGLEFDIEKKDALEQLRKGAWAAVEGIDNEEQWPDDATAVVVGEEFISQDQSTTGLISSSLLEKMQAARAAREQLSKAKQVEQEQEAKGDSVSFGPRRTLILLQGTETFQDILQSLPKGLAIVEYFHIEVWTKKTLLMEIEKGNIVREMLVGRSESEEDLKQQLGKRDREEKSDIISITKKIKGETTSNALGTLTAYDSSDEEEDDGNEEVFGVDEDTDLEETTNTKQPPVLSGLAEMARSLGMVPTS